MRIWLRLAGMFIIGIFYIPIIYFVSDVKATTTVTTTKNITVSVQIIGPQVCGNGYLEPPEECDDGNLVNGDGCSDQCLLEQITPTSTPSVGWSGGKTLTTIEFFGVTSPYALVSLTKFGRVVAITQADAVGNFTFRLSALPIGTYDFGLFAEDRFSRFTLTTNLSLSLVARSITTVQNIFLTPTISISRRDIMPGQILMVFGETAPNSLVQLYLGSELIDQVVYSDNNGFWQFELDSTALSAGAQSIKAKSLTTDGLESNFSESLFFEVVPAPIPQGQCAGPDLNFDGWVNVFDLSILLNYWRQATPSFICADINQDGFVDIVDFSILFYWWSESL